MLHSYQINDVPKMNVQGMFMRVT